MKNKNIIVLVPLNVQDYTDSENEQEFYVREFLKHIDREGKDEIWIKNRLNVFMNYTYKSLINQTNQDFTAYVMYNDKTEKLILSELEKYEKLPKNIIFTKKTKVDELIKDKILGREYVYFVRIDSDDMYHKSYIQKLYDYNPLPETVSLVNEWAYLYNSSKNELYVCNAKITSCYTLICKTLDYLIGRVPTAITDQLDAQMCVAWWLAKKEYLDGLNYLWHVHSKNTVTSTEEYFTNQWTNYLSKQIKDQEVITQVMNEFMG